jgi:hypothetical protein
MTKTEDAKMKRPNKPVRTWGIHVKNAVLTALHVLVLVVSLVVHPPIENRADRVLT